MSEGWLLFLLGIVVSIPVGVVTPFLTARLQQKLGERTKRDALRRRRNLEREMVEVSTYRNNFPVLVTFLLGRLVTITLASVVVAILPALISMIGAILTAMSYDPQQYESSSRAYALSNYLYAGSYVVSVIGFGVVIQLCTRTLRVYSRVSEYDKYIQAWRDELGRLKGVPSGDAAPEATRVPHQDRPADAMPSQRDRRSSRAPDSQPVHRPADEPTIPSWAATPYVRPVSERRP